MPEEHLFLVLVSAQVQKCKPQKKQVNRKTADFQWLGVIQLSSAVTYTYTPTLTLALLTEKKKENQHVK